MNKNAFSQMKNTQMEHWWFRGRREIIGKVILSLNLPHNAKIIEIGCGTGGNLQWLTRFGDVAALEINKDAREYAASISGIDIHDGWLPDGLSCIKGKTFDLICLLDVLEHVADDEQSLRNLKNHLSFAQPAKGKLLITVPAYQWMFSQHDKELSHFRRYSKTDLSDKLIEAGYKINYIGYMNTMLFAPMLLSRLTEMFLDTRDIGTGIPTPLLNGFMFRIFSFEKLIIPKISLPFGGSLIAVCSI